MKLSHILTIITILFVIIFLPISTSKAEIAENTEATETTETAPEETEETTESSEITIIEEPSTFTVCYQRDDSEITADVEIGSGFTLPNISSLEFKGWYLSKEQDNQTLYYSFNAVGELGWRTSSDVVAYYVFYNQDEISSSECEKLSSGEPIYFRAVYAKHSIDDAITSKWKGFESYTSISNKQTLNHHIAYGKTYKKSDGTKVEYNTTTDATTGIRYVLKNDIRYYCVALGSYYGSVGSTHLVILDNHVAFNIMVTDNKSVKDAVTKNVDGKEYTIYHDKTGVYPVSHQHEYIEFVIDEDVISHKIYKYGCLNIKYTIYDGNVIGIN